MWVGCLWEGIYIEEGESAPVGCLCAKGSMHSHFYKSKMSHLDCLE